MKGLDYPNERYVRLYTRDTASWMVLGWEAQALYPQLRRKADRSGVLDLGEEEMSEAVCGLFPGWPTEVVEKGLTRLLAKGWVDYNEDLNWVLIPDFQESEEAAATAAQRSREHRARRAASERVQRNVADQNETLQNETGSNAVKHSDTPYLPVPTRTVPSEDGDGPEPKAAPRPSLTPEPGQADGALDNNQVWLPGIPEPEEAPAREDAGEPPELDVAYWFPVKKGARGNENNREVTGKPWKYECPITRDQVARWEQLYDGLDIAPAIRDCLRWDYDNPARIKTAAGLSNHVGGWIARDNDKGKLQEKKPERHWPTWDEWRETGRPLWERPSPNWPMGMPDPGDTLAQITAQETAAGKKLDKNFCLVDMTEEERAEAGLDADIPF